MFVLRVLQGRREAVVPDETKQFAFDRGIVLTRNRAAMPTIEFLRSRVARLVLLSHLGRPKGGPDPKYSMEPVVREVERLLGAPVTFLRDPLSEQAVTESRRLPRGGVAIAENTRFWMKRNGFTCW